MSKGNHKTLTQNRHTRTGKDLQDFTGVVYAYVVVSQSVRAETKEDADQILNDHFFEKLKGIDPDPSIKVRELTQDGKVVRMYERDRNEMLIHTEPNAIRY